MSSAAPRQAIAIIAPAIAGIETAGEPSESVWNAAPTVTNVAAMTAMPPPCGVGAECDDRAFGFAKATRVSHGNKATVNTAVSSAATTTVAALTNPSRLLVAAIIIFV